MIENLYREIYGDQGIPITQENFIPLVKALALLPKGMGNFLIRYYVWQQTIEEISAETGDAIPLLERWKVSGIGLLKLWLTG